MNFPKARTKQKLLLSNSALRSPQQQAVSSTKRPRGDSPLSAASLVNTARRLECPGTTAAISLYNASNATSRLAMLLQCSPYNAPSVSS
eukprot:168131-Amphidinium_carterae.1